MVKGAVGLFDVTLDLSSCGALEPGDRLVPCSDGIHDEIGEEMLWELFDPSLDVAAQTKIWRDAVWKCGAKDNLSLVVVTLC